MLAIENGELVVYKKSDFELTFDDASALRAQQERENPQPLTVLELNHKLGKPVFSGFDGEWHIVKEITSIDAQIIRVKFTDGEVAEGTEETLKLYAHEPKGEHHGVGSG